MDVHEALQAEYDWCIRSLSVAIGECDETGILL
jgi:hypothetical protein